MAKSSTERSREWRLRNPGADAAKTAKYAKSEKGKENERKKSKKRRTIMAGGNYEDVPESLVISTYGTKCHICHIEIDMTASRQNGIGNWQYGLHIDHVIPLSKGGSNTLDNMKPAHAICNTKKGGN